MTEKTNTERLGVLEDWRIRMDEWQKDQNGSLKSLADSFEKLSTCVTAEKSYRRGFAAALSLLGAVAGSGITGVAVYFTQGG